MNVGKPLKKAALIAFSACAAATTCFAQTVTADYPYEGQPFTANVQQTEFSAVDPADGQLVTFQLQIADLPANFSGGTINYVSGQSNPYGISLTMTSVGAFTLASTQSNVQSNISLTLDANKDLAGYNMTESAVNPQGVTSQYISSANYKGMELDTADINGNGFNTGANRFQGAAGPSLAPQIAAVPEPSTLVPVLGGIAFLAARRRRALTKTL